MDQIVSLPAGFSSLLQLLMSSAGGLVGVLIFAFFTRKDKDALTTDNQSLTKIVIDQQNARIASLERSSEACDQRFNMLLQHVLASKG